MLFKKSDTATKIFVGSYTAQKTSRAFVTLQRFVTLKFSREILVLAVVSQGKNENCLAFHFDCCFSETRIQFVSILF